MCAIEYFHRGFEIGFCEAGLQFRNNMGWHRCVVFGKGVAVEWSDKDHQHATHWKSKYDASQIPLMQVLEHGTVRDDAMPESPAGGGKKKIYNSEVIATLARFGWSPGAAFGDTMHFDFIEGYNKAVPGGRNGENMKPTRYSPEGATHDTDPAKK